MTDSQRGACVYGLHGHGQSSWQTQLQQRNYAWLLQYPSRFLAQGEHGFALNETWTLQTNNDNCPLQVWRQGGTLGSSAVAKNRNNICTLGVSILTMMVNRVDAWLNTSTDNQDAKSMHPLLVPVRIKRSPHTLKATRKPEPPMYVTLTSNRITFVSDSQAPSRPGRT